MEIWKTCEDCSNYEISSLGNIRHKINKINLKPYLNHKGYKRIKVVINGKRLNFSIHRLVAKAFINNPENKPMVNHKDTDKLNNSIDNLEWCTNKENMKHAYDNGLSYYVKDTNGKFKKAS